MKRCFVLAGLCLAVLLTIATVASAANPGHHYFDCKKCHKAGLSVTSMSGNNICLQCHGELSPDMALAKPLAESPPSLDGHTEGRRDVGDASNLFNHNPINKQKETSHIWGTASDTFAPAGAQAPSRTNFAGFYSRYNSSTGKVTCSRCHNPHGETEIDILNNSTGLPTADLVNNRTGVPGADGMPDGDGLPDNTLANTLLLQRDASNGGIPLTPEKLCRACHVAFDQPNANHATKTHPLLADYAAFQALPANVAKYKTPAEIASITDNSKVKLVKVMANGTEGVGCTSCHAAHYVDSNSTTPDGAADRGELAFSDGHLLRSDGPLRGGLTRNTPKGPDRTLGTADDGAPGTAQIRSNLCQSCHNYKVHGKGAIYWATAPYNLKYDDDAQIGCLDCHGGHSYNGGTESAYVLADRSPDAVPIRANRAYWGTAEVDYPTFLVTGSTRLKWSDNTEGTATGFCEKCHGDTENMGVGGVGNASAKHAAGTIDECDECHLHGDPGFSFANDANATTCGQCHGFPPYLSLPGDRDTGGTDGGYAVNEVDLPAYNYQADSGHYKLEANTAHKAHAGKGLPGDVGNWYFVGTTGLDNCKVCHGVDAGSASGNHRINNAVTFYDMPFYGIAKTGGLNPVYRTSTPSIWTCTATYCHSTGGTRTGNGPTRNYLTWATTPAWDIASGGGNNSIIGNANRCGYCHGNDATDMVTKNDSARHVKHLQKGFSCNVCHTETAASDTALVAGATDGKNGGKHVNGLIEVTYVSSGSALFTAVGASSNGANWEAPGGTCSVYCHDPLNTGKTADWDVPGPLACDACHGGKATDATTINSGSHYRHVKDPNGPLLTCDKCHGANANAGTHAAHVNGTSNIQGTDWFQSACNTCHGIDGVEVLPEWGNIGTSKCTTCHTGSTTTAAAQIWATSDAAPAKASALTTGHGKTSGSYSVTNRPAANQDCEACHDRNAVGHFDSDNLDKRLLGTYTCEGCHDGTPAIAVRTHSNTDPSYTGQKRADFSKTCLACHDPHGSSSLAMIAPTRTDFGGTVVFSSFGVPVANTAVANDNSFDESADSPASNLDDICATCHTTVLHNNRARTGTHHEGKTCTSCHSHNGNTGGFMPNGGTACNDCHGNPPSTGDARHTAAKIGAHELHAQTTIHDKDLPEHDATDCDACHPGASSYTYSHSNSVLDLAPGMAGGATGCTAACHLSTAGDGFWTDTTKAGLTGNGLNCSSCHYNDVAPTQAGNTAAGSRALTGSHGQHFAKGKTCSACHTYSGDYNGGTGHVGPMTHIDSYVDTTAADDDGAMYADKAAATQDEGTVLAATYGTGSDPDPGNPTCAGSGVALGCHNTKTTPAWGAGSITCTNCHDPAGSAAADPKTGLHNVAAAGVQKHDSTLSGGCTACHNSTKPATHTDGAFNNDTAVRTDRFLTVRVGMFTDNATPNRGTCSGTGNLTGCHSDTGRWTRLWSTEANSTATTSGSARCNVCHGQYSTLSGSGGLGWNPGTSHYQTYGGAASTRGSSHKSQPGENNACEDCHSYTTLTGNHENGSVTMNNDAVTVQVTRASSRVYCAYCHGTGDPLVSGTYTFTQSGFPQQLVAGANDPKQECNSCHGDGTGRYWPMGAYGGGHAANDGGRHEIHLTRLAKAKYNMTVAELLADADVKNKQIFLCQYCHNATVPGQNPGHTDSAYPAEVSSTMYPLWDATHTAPDTVTYTGTGANGTGTCANANCHNNKNTNSVANFTWHGTGTQNCLLCHNDITNTTAGTTGATHQAHVAAPTLGKVIDCTSCHGGTPTWAPYAVPASNHINGTFNVGTAGGSSVPFTYTGVYTDQATRTVGTCNTNLCHNNGKNAATAAYTWQTAITGTCTACHATSSTLGSSHNAHLVGTFATTFGKTLYCDDCHEAVVDSTSDMTGKTGHMNGTVTLAAGLTYSGTPNSLDVTVATTYGNCTGLCHTNGKAAAPVTAANWNTTYANCSICHALPNSIGNDGARHTKHVANSAKLPASCGECHLNATTTTYNSANHLNSTVNTGNKISAHTNGAATCTNSCHLVDISRGDWLDTATLACTDCHSGTYIGKAAKNNTSGLHQATTALAHDDAFGASGTCTSCHNAITIDSPATHVNGLTNDPNTAFGLFGSYNTGTSSCSGSGVATNCHTDGGDWSRRWNGVVDAKPLNTNNPGDPVCYNCHGDHVSGWRWTEANATTTDHTDPNGNLTNNVTSSHNTCQTCHGWGHASYNRTWLGSSNINYKGHGDGHITLNGPSGTGAGYDNTNGGCNAACHSNDTSHRLKFNSGWTENYADFGSANTCEACHAAKVAEAKHARHNNVSPTIDNDLTDCAKCHPNAASYTPAGGHADHKNSSVTLGAGISSGASGCTAACHASSAADGFWTDANGLNCTACHYAAAAPTGAGNTAHARPLSSSHNKHFNKGKLCSDCHSVAFSPTIVSIVGPLAHITDTTGANQGAVFTGKAAALQDEATAARTNVIFDDDGADNINGNADDNTCANNGGGLALGCHASGTPDWDNSITTCIVCHTNETDAAVNPTSGLHNFSTATRHDDTLQSGVCINCHSASSPSSLHQNGTKDSASTATFTWNANVTAYSVANGCNATCHTDGGDWRRKWASAVDARPLNTNNPGDAVCDNCHGAPTAFDTASSWRWNEVNGTTVDHTDPYAPNGSNKMDQHGGCQTCHGWGTGAYNETWRGASDALYIGHGDGYITLNGPVGTGTGYNNTSGGCAAACHAETLALNTNSGWTANFGNFGGGACNSCHGYPPLETLDAVNFPYGGLQKYAGSGKTHALNKHVAYGVNISGGWANCTKCHTEADHNMSATGWAANRTSKTYPKVNLSTTLNWGTTARYTMGNADTVDGMGQCFGTTCHFTESPKWDCSP